MSLAFFLNLCSLVRSLGTPFALFPDGQSRVAWRNRVPPRGLGSLFPAQETRGKCALGVRACVPLPPFAPRWPSAPPTEHSAPGGPALCDPRKLSSRQNGLARQRLLQAEERWRRRRRSRRRRRNFLRGRSLHRAAGRDALDPARAVAAGSQQSPCLRLCQEPAPHCTPPRGQAGLVGGAAPGLGEKLEELGGEEATSSQETLGFF